MNFVYFILVLYFYIKNEKTGKYKNIQCMDFLFVTSDIAKLEI